MEDFRYFAITMLILCLGFSSCSISNGIDRHGLCVSNCVTTYNR